jgi:DNA polymerase III alpha subunit (gram-positive type)
MASKYLFIFDIETSGLPEKNKEPVIYNLAAQIYNSETFEKVDELELYMIPNLEIPFSNFSITNMLNHKLLMTVDEWQQANAIAATYETMNKIRGVKKESIFLQEGPLHTPHYYVKDESKFVKGKYEGTVYTFSPAKPWVNEESAVRHLIDFLAKYSYEENGRKVKPVPAGHNVSRFDIPILSTMLGSHGIRIDTLLDYHCVDTAVLAYTHLVMGTRTLSKVNLATVAEYLNIPYTNEAHTAMFDVQVTAEVLKWFIKSFENNEPLSEEESNPVSYAGTLNIRPVTFASGDRIVRPGV